jgi:1-acyl-sn-glycerol-3-phosphate acyltransferase
VSDVARPFRPFRRVTRIAGFVGITSLMLPAYALREAVARPARKDRVRDAWVGAWSGGLLRLFAVDVDLVGALPDPQSGPGRLIVANHRSALDIAILLRAFGGHMVSRADVARWPLVGTAARKVGTVFVDRANAWSGAGAIRDIRRLLVSGQSVLLFPEGTTFDGDIVRPFHAGAFIATLRTDAEIVPVGLAYPHDSGAAFLNETFTHHLFRMAGADPTRVVVRVGAPIPVAPGVRAAELARTASEAVQALVHEARAAVQEGSGG